MKRHVMLAMTGGIILAATATVYAASVSPYGQVGSFDKVALTVDRSSIEDKGVMIEGKLYAPVDALRDQNKLAYYYDSDKYQAHLFFGGASNGVSQPNQVARSGTNVSTEVISSIMSGIPYDAAHYHAGMMRQDIVNIATLAKGLLDTSRDLDNVVYAKLTFNRDPDFQLLEQRLSYRSLPFEVMEDRMDALADELGTQIRSSSKRKMKDVTEEMQKAVTKKEKALDALKDWVRTSNEDDLEDFRDYEKDAKDSIYSAIKDLTGEDLKMPSKSDPEDGLKAGVEEWSKKQQKIGK